MDERSTRERRNKLLILLLSVGIVVCLAITIWAVFFRRPAPAPEPDYAAPELEQNAEPAKGSGTKLDIPAGGGGISISYSSAVTVSLSGGEVQFQYTHPSSSTQNIVLCVEVEGTVIAQSGLILPGSQLQTLSLLEGAADTLSEGTYTNADFRILSYDPESGEKAMVDTLAQITVTVQS